MKLRALDKMSVLRMSAVLLALVMVFTAVFAVSGPVYAEGEDQQQGEVVTDPTPATTPATTPKKTPAKKKLTKTQQYKNRMIARAKKKKSRTKWLILVDKKTHRVGIFKGSKGKWKLKKFWKCGDGKASTPTPSGTYRISRKGPYFDSGSARCYYFTQFRPHYYFHSVLCNPRTGAPYGGTQTGVGVSHGCVRLAKGNALWLQNHIPAGTTVYIYKK